MQTQQRNTNGESSAIRFAFYDKTKSANNGWCWFHRELCLEEIRSFYQDHLRSYFGNSVPEDWGYVSHENRLVVFQYVRSGVDDKGRDHWVLILAWLPESRNGLDAWSVRESALYKAVLQHVSSGTESVPEQLFLFDYQPDMMKLAFEGGTKEDIPNGKGRDYVREIEKIGAARVVFYCEKRGGNTTIRTERNEGS
jgi:hypothetical protein